MSDMAALVHWLREQIAEDERVALAASPPPWTDGGYGEFGLVVHSEPYTEETLSVELSDSDQGRADIAHLTRFDPAWVLAEVAAKRAILDEHPDIGHGCGTCVVGKWGYPEKGGSHPEPWPCATIRLLAQPYASRPGFRPEWTVVPPG